MRNILLILTFLTALFFSPEASAQVTLKADSVSISCSSSDTFLIPIRITGVDSIGSFQFTLMWDTAKLDYAYTTALSAALQGAGVDYDSNTTQVSAGKIAFIWTKVEGAGLPSDSVIFRLAFRRIGGSFASLMFVDTPVSAEVADANAGILNLSTVNGGVQPVDNEPPAITCPADVTVQGVGPTPVNGIALNNISDNCAPLGNIGWVSVGATNASQPNDPDASGATFNIGQSVVTYTGTDVGGNSATCSFSVTVELSNTSDTLTIIAQNVTASCSQTVSINITALNFDSIGSLQFSMGWDAAVLQFSSVSNFNPALQLVLGDNFNTTQTGTGLLAFLWTANDAAGITLPPGATLFTINLNVQSSGGSNSTLTFGDSPVIREVFSNASGSPEEVGAFWINGAVNVADNIPPILECPGDVAVVLPPGNTNVAVNGLQPIALLDNCPGNLNLAYLRTGATTGSGNGNADGTYNPGVTTVTYTATDAAGNISTCSFLVTVDAPGVLTLLIDSVEVDCQSSGDTVAVNLFVENWDDIVGLQFDVSWDETVLGFVSIGNLNATLGLLPTDFGTTQTATGLLSFFAGGPSSGWPQQLPDGTVMFTIFFEVLNPGATSAISYTGTIEPINSQINIVPFTTVPGFFSAGADNTPPVVTCPQNFTVDIIGNECNTNVNVPLPIAADSCSGIDTITRVPAGDVFVAGITSVVYTVTDNAGNAANCSFTITVLDNTPPSFATCPSNVTGVASGFTCEGQVNWADPVPTDPCGQAGLLVTSNYTQDSMFGVGQTLVLYTVTDGSANSAICSFTVTLQDTTKPVIVCPGNLTVSPDGSPNCSAVVDYDLPIGLDNCDATVAVTAAPGNTFAPNDTFPAGTTILTYVASDDFNNQSSCTFTISVVDNEPPVLTCPTDITVAASQNTCGANVSWDPATALDACDGTLTTASTSQPGDLFQVGTTPVLYTATDGSNNIGECTFNVTVTETVPPIILGCPADIIILLTSGDCSTTAFWTPPQATDNCGLQSLVASHLPGNTFQAGTTTVTYTATDLAGNSSICSFNVVAQDEINPVLSNCPANITVNDSGGCGQVVDWMTPTVSDNCTPDSAIVVIASDTSGSVFYNGTTTVFYIAYDASNNQDTCVFSITISGGSQPGFVNIPSPIMLQGCSAVATWIAPTPTGFCGVDTLYSNFQPGDTFPAGVTTVTYTAVDSVTGLPTSVNFTVSVLETEPPAFDCPAGPIVVNVGGGVASDPDEFLLGVTNVAGCTSVDLDFDLPLATDNCGVDSLAQTAGLPPGAFPVGTQTLTFYAADASGNTAQCSVTVEVQGIPALTVTSQPTLGCLNEPVTITATPIAGATYTWTKDQQPLSDTDNTISITEFFAANEGVYTVFANVNGCVTPLATITMDLATAPDAVEDLILVPPDSTIVFNVFDNDILTPVSDFEITNNIDLQGLTYLGNGSFEYVAGTGGEFLYEVCSESCPDLCEQVLVRIVVQDDRECDVPNIITPNGDDINDWLVIPCLDTRLYPNNSIVIYNQWGDKVYDASPYFNSPQVGTQKIPWRGTLNGNSGQDLPDGTYFYVFKPGPGVPTIKGFVQIIR
jgi:gliding motility-associated-like protein